MIYRTAGSVGLLLTLACSTSAPSARVGRAALEAPQAADVPLRLWLRGDSAEAAARGLEVVAHPCGYTVQVAVARLQPNEPSTEAELVLEYDARGRVVQSWLMPVDVVVAALQDSLLFVPHDAEHADRESTHLAIAPSGYLRLVRDIPVSQRELVEPCPEFTEFAGSGFVICQRLADLASGQARTIAYQMPCT